MMGSEGRVDNMELGWEVDLADSNAHTASIKRSRNDSLLGNLRGSENVERKLTVPSLTAVKPKWHSSKKSVTKMSDKKYQLLQDQEDQQAGSSNAPPSYDYPTAPANDFNGGMKDGY
jgi:hypothetical protein